MAMLVTFLASFLGEPLVTIIFIEGDVKTD